MCFMKWFFKVGGYIWYTRSSKALSSSDAAAGGEAAAGAVSTNPMQQSNAPVVVQLSAVSTPAP